MATNRNENIQNEERMKRICVVCMNRVCSLCNKKSVLKYKIASEVPLFMSKSFFIKYFYNENLIYFCKSHVISFMKMSTVKNNYDGELNQSLWQKFLKKYPLKNEDIFY